MSGNWSSRHLVSCSARTSTSRRCSQAATRSARLRTEFTFQVASRTPPHLTESHGSAFRAVGLRSRLADGLLAAGGGAGAGPLAALDEPRRLRVQALEEHGQRV